jgi:two-component system response regulator AtoC
MDRGDDDEKSGALTTIEGKAEHPPGPVQLVASGPYETFLAYNLPREGTVTIGRGGGTDVELRDRRVSRQHARLHVGAAGTFAIEDLGSANGTQVGGGRLPPGEAVPIAVGEAIFIGSTIASLQPTVAGQKVRRADPAPGLDAGVAQACLRGLPFTVVVICVLDGFAADQLVDVAAEHRGKDAFFAGRDGTEYAALIVGDPAAAPGTQPPFATALARLAPAVVAGHPRFPGDGQAPEALIAEARARAEAACVAVPPGDAIVFCDKLMRRLYDLARRAAAGQVNVLVIGETGVGKDVMARMIHSRSPRSEGPFQRIECAALTESLAESELFGHERGAFTGALAVKPGLIEAADRGTLFLDEVGELSPRLQAKLLHVLENRQTTRVGAIRGRAVDVRFVAATNRNLDEDVARGLFRRDLYYRLNGFLITIPPLRDRRGEIAPLARSMLREACRQHGRVPVPTRPASSAAALEAHDWPGNARELRNVIERAVLMCDGASIELHHLLLDSVRVNGAGSDDKTTATSPAFVDAPRLSPEEAEEKRRIEQALAACGGNQSRAAKMLDMGRSTLVLRLDAFGITRPRKRGG